MDSNEPIGVYVNRISRGEKYLFANLSIPWTWVPPGTPFHREGVSRMLEEWRTAWLREQQPK